MFGFGKHKEIEKLTESARSFMTGNYVPIGELIRQEFDKFKTPTDRYGVQNDNTEQDSRNDGIKFSPRGSFLGEDNYDMERVAKLMEEATGCNSQGISEALENTINQTFTDKLIDIINQKGFRDAEVYKAAHMDRRLFSKIMSDRDYKPSKDTALALIFALRLTLPQATDLLSRAGFILSHSSKRDVILEYFIREGVFNLTDINIVLENLEQKIIGR